MKILIQTVSKASVMVDNATVGSIKKGALIFLGITHSDTKERGQFLAGKLIHLRMFKDAEGKTNHSLLDIEGEILIISQFTLYADCLSGRRPSFTQAAPPDMAKELYENFIKEVKKSELVVQTGIFGAYMEVSLVNQGPFTLMIEKTDD